MVCRIIASHVASRFKHFTEGMIDYSGMKLTQLNGTQFLKRGIWSNLEINGQAHLGDMGERAVFEKILVVNGDLKAENCTFDILDSRGNFIVRNCLLRDSGIFFGNGTIECCEAKGLKLTSHGGAFKIFKSMIEGDLHYSSMGYVDGELCLDNTTVRGAIHTPKGDASKIKMTNCPLTKIIEH